MMNQLRKNHELPPATEIWGWRFHHVGIPTKNKIQNERYIPQLKMFVSGFETNPYGIEWMRFEPDSPVNFLIQSVPHIAFVVDDLSEALENKEVISGPASPSKGVKVAMIRHNWAPVELMEFVE
jgi:hypothetical protein